MLTIYLDDSDADTGAVMTIAGYLAEQDDWARFEAHAEKVCHDFDVDVIHCREFEKNKGCFKGWSIPRKTAFMLAIRDAMLGTVLCGISRSMPKDYYKARKAQLRLNPQIGAYGFCFGTIVHTLCHGNEVGLMDQVKAEGVAYKVETGHKNNPERECQDFRVRAGIMGKKGVPLCLDAKSLPYRMSFSISFWRAALPAPPSSRAVCSIR